MWTYLNHYLHIMDAPQMVTEICQTIQTEFVTPTVYNLICVVGCPAFQKSSAIFPATYPGLGIYLNSHQKSFVKFRLNLTSGRPFLFYKGLNGYNRQNSQMAILAIMVIIARHGCRKERLDFRNAVTGNLTI